MKQEAREAAECQPLPASLTNLTLTGTAHEAHEQEKHDQDY